MTSDQSAPARRFDGDFDKELRCKTPRKYLYSLQALISQCLGEVCGKFRDRIDRNETTGDCGVPLSKNHNSTTATNNNNSNNDNNNGNMANARNRFLYDLTIRLLLKVCCMSDGTGSVKKCSSVDVVLSL